MRPSGPTFWLLDGRVGWRTGSTDGVVTDDRDGLRLAADPDGPLSLASRDGSLGRLVLPERVAIDGSAQLFLLMPHARPDPPAGDRSGIARGDRPHHLWRLDAGTGVFTGLADTGCAGAQVRDLGQPKAIAAHGSDLYVADPGNRRVTIFDTRTLALRGGWAGPQGVTDWRPSSVAVGSVGGYVLDAEHGLVHRFADPSRPPEQVRLGRPGRWRRLALDRDGLLHLLATDRQRLDVFAPDGSFLGSVTDAAEVAGGFDPPAVVADDRVGGWDRIQVPPSLLGPCPGLAPPDSTSVWFDATTGRPAASADDAWVGPATYRRRGSWISEPLDSALYRCQWHRVATELGRLPTGSRLTVSTYTDTRVLARDEVRALPPELWSRAPDLVGPPAQARARQHGRHDGDAAVRSGEGRYLWLRLDLSGNGHDTPTVSAVRVHYPRRSHIGLLPAVYSSDDAARRFLERFLSVMQTQLEPVERTIRDMAGLFDPDSAPPGMVDLLSSWLAVPVEGDRDVARQRALVRTISGTLTRRGTPDALRRYVRAHLAHLTGQDLVEDHFPHVVEGYRERNHLMLTAREPLGGRLALWGPGQVGRLQLDRFAREGEVRLVTTGDPARDLFHHYAHRFRVVIPAPWVRTAADERIVRRAVEAEKPAHTSYELDLVVPAVRAGRQATVGLDTVVGGLPRARLACRHDELAAPSRPPQGRLGVDTVLSAGPSPHDMRLPARVGSHAPLH
jgi:phage tail-like protein